MTASAPLTPPYTRNCVYPFVYIASGNTSGELIHPLIPRHIYTLTLLVSLGRYNNVIAYPSIYTSVYDSIRQYHPDSDRDGSLAFFRCNLNIPNLATD